LIPGLKPKFFAFNTCLNLIRGFSPMGIIRIKLTWRGMGKIFLQNSSIMFKCCPSKQENRVFIKIKPMFWVWVATGRLYTRSKRLALKRIFKINIISNNSGPSVKLAENNWKINFEKFFKFYSKFIPLYIIASLFFLNIHRVYLCYISFFSFLLK
jgi:ribosomal protein L24E